MELHNFHAGNDFEYAYMKADNRYILISGNCQWIENYTHFHRDDDLPAVEQADGTKYWYKHGTLHRIGGPAIIRANGDEEWYVKGVRHRADGPAVYNKFSKNASWYYEGQLHRDYGPAIEWVNVNAWYIEGELHREDGPAIISKATEGWYIKNKKHRLDGPAITVEGNKFYFINDRQVYEEDYDKEVKIYLMTQAIEK